MLIHTIEIICIVAFALSAVISEANISKDIVSVMVLGWITALGGGTVRDIILSTGQVFWIRDPSYFWTALITSFIGFFLAPHLRKIKAERLIVVLDAIGIAMFSVLVTKNMVAEHYAGYVAVTMGMITAVFGGVLRDVILARPTMFNNTEFYASPVIIGCYLYILQLKFSISPNIATLTSISFIIIVRMYIVIKKITFPNWLLLK
ncbi:hypothetical protein UB37_18715 [Photobacterium iliopiscarium]|uniref:Glycine transporter domain-containing protein n=1 Tax=Photobacterium iliopiscarium TaxID=56192 RepID=A0ABX5GME0_9GAMM|nr:TRIC cation channel family protein [Photobacterium iliopiscarium]KJG19353.1 hypothetical protein UB37_18715 [Photobacterium iliopiscarium]PSW91206.1 hypothetical protein C9J52_19600 [Photobacterium iliopiscarium]